MRWTNLTLSAEEGRRLPGYRDEALVRRFDAPEALDVRFYEVRARSVLNRVPERSAMPFRWTVNPYRGCTHACVYCFARQTHTYLDFDAGRDFEREIVVKVNAPEVLARELARPSWTREHVALGTNTDPYQWVEARYCLMPGIWRALLEHATPCSVLTKSPLLLRDLPLLRELAGAGLFGAALSIPTLEERAWRATEPHAAPGGAARGGREAGRGRRAHERADRAPDAGHQRRPGGRGADRGAGARGGGPQRHADRAASAQRRSRGVHGLAGGRAPRARAAIRGALREGRIRARRRAPPTCGAGARHAAPRRHAALHTARPVLRDGA